MSSMDTLGVYLRTAPHASNRHGRTGLRGRGLLGRFGPNHAADPIVTRCVVLPVLFYPT